MKTHITWIRMASVVLLAWIVAEGSVGTRSGTAIEIGVTGRTNANASIASSSSFVGVAWAARTKDGVTDVYVATSRDGGRSFGAPVRVNQVPGEASVSGEQPPRIVLSSRDVDQSRNRGAVDGEVCIRDSSRCPRALLTAGSHSGRLNRFPGAMGAEPVAGSLRPSRPRATSWPCGWIIARYRRGRLAQQRMTRTSTGRRANDRRPMGLHVRNSRRSLPPG